MRTLHTRVDRVHRQVQRQVHRQAHLLPETLKAKVQQLPRRTQDKNKLYALHTPEVACISKGKA